MQRLLLSIVVILLFGAMLQAKESAPIRLTLGGPRKVKVVIVTKQDSFSITVRMIEVKCFDAATNKRLNRQKARGYALLAITQHLGIDETFVIRGIVIEEVGVENKRFFITISIPINGIEPRKQFKPKAPDQGEQEVKSGLDETQGILAARDNYLVALDELLSSLLKHLPPIPKKMTGEDDFLHAIVDLEESGLKGFSSLQNEIYTDQRLLEIEVNEITSRINQAEIDFIERLRQHVDKFQATAKTE